MKLLYVENHATFATTVVERFLAEHEVVVASSVASALREYARCRFDVALVDYDLDDEKGDVLIRKLRQRGATIPIVAVSARDAGNDLLMNAGANAVCPKLRFSGIADVLTRLEVTA